MSDLLLALELGDLCVDFENGFSVQRVGSVANAAIGTLDPCVPSNGEVYFNGFPTEPEPPRRGPRVGRNPSTRGV